MHYPVRRCLQACSAALLMLSGIAATAHGSSLMSTSMVSLPSVTGDEGVFTPSAPPSLGLAAPTPAQNPLAQAASTTDSATTTPLATDFFGSVDSLSAPLFALDWTWSTDASMPTLPLLTAVGSTPAMALAGVAGTLPPPLAYWQADRGTDPSMRLAGWNDVFNVARLAQFEIPLRSDPAERTNIILSAQAVDGVMLQPGDVFSFNDVVGERSADKGYQDGWMFDQGKLIRGTGGGICLVATGLYNAALNAGLGLIERHPHSGLVRYAPPGCDAAVVYGSEDLKFQNTTAGPVFVRTIFQDDKVVVALFGTPPPLGYHVVVRPKTFALVPWTTIQKPDPTLLPGQTVVDQKPHSGYVVTVERVFLQGDRVLREEVVANDKHPAVDEIVRVPVPASTGADDLDAFVANMLADPQS